MEIIIDPQKIGDILEEGWDDYKPTKVEKKLIEFCNKENCEILEKSGKSWKVWRTRANYPYSPHTGNFYDSLESAIAGAMLESLAWDRAKSKSVYDEGRDVLKSMIKNKEVLICSEEPFERLFLEALGFKEYWGDNPYPSAIIGKEKIFPNCYIWSD